VPDAYGSAFCISDDHDHSSGSPEALAVIKGNMLVAQVPADSSITQNREKDRYLKLPLADLPASAHNPFAEEALHVSFEAQRVLITSPSVHLEFYRFSPRIERNFPKVPFQRFRQDGL
jgi:hypothetical protein